MYYALTSSQIKFFGMKTESEFPHICKKYLRQHGIPHISKRYNAKSENSQAIKNINREYIIADKFNETHHL